MRSAIIVLILTFIVAGCGQHEDPAAVKRLLREKVGSFTEAFNKQNIDGLMADLWNSPDVVGYYPGGSLIGYNAVRQSWEGFFQNLTVKRFTITDQNIEVDNRTAYHWGLYDIVIEPKGGPEITLPGRFTQVWRRIDGKWVVVIDHASHPLPPPGP